MTIPTGTAIKQYTGNGSTKIFSFPFYIFAAAEIQVWEIDTTDPTDTETLIGSGYTVNGVGTDTGNVTYTVAPATGIRITIIQVPLQEQTTDYVANENIPAEAHETQVDKIVAMVKSLQEQIDRCIQLPRSIAAAFDPVVDVLPPGANRALFSNAAVDGFDWSSTDLSDIDDSVAAAATSEANAATSETNAGTSATNAATSETNAAASAAAAAASAASIEVIAVANNVTWECTSTTEVVIDSGSQVKGVDSGQVFTFASNRTFDIAATKGLGAINTIVGGSATANEANSTIYILIATLDTTGSNDPHVVAVSASEWASFVTTDLTALGYDDYKRIGWVFNDSSGNLQLARYIRGVLQFDDTVYPTELMKSVTSATYVDVDFSVPVPSFIDRIVLRVLDSTLASIWWREKGSSSDGHKISQGLVITDNKLVDVILNSSGIFEAKRSAGTVDMQLHQCFDDLQEEGQ